MKRREGDGLTVEWIVIVPLVSQAVDKYKYVG